MGGWTLWAGRTLRPLWTLDILRWILLYTMRGSLIVPNLKTGKNDRMKQVILLEIECIPVASQKATHFNIPRFGPGGPMGGPRFIGTERSTKLISDMLVDVIESTIDSQTYLQTASFQADGLERFAWARSVYLGLAGILHVLSTNRHDRMAWMVD